MPMRYSLKMSGLKATQVSDQPAERISSSEAVVDFGTVTILYSQPIGGLQILSPDNKWRWIKHIDNALVSSPSTLSVNDSRVS